MDETRPRLSTIDAVRAFGSEVTTLIDTNAAEAIRRVRAVEAEPAVERAMRSVRAAIFIDAGAKTRQVEVIEDGVTILRELQAARPEEPSYRYNLANGLIAIADLEGTALPRWYLATRNLRQEARELLDSVRGCGQPELETQALTNLGNALSRSHRWSEAYDAYVAALATDPSNGVAAGCAAQMLQRGVSAGVGNAARMQLVASRYAAIAKANRERVVKFAGASAAETFARLPGGEPGDVGPELSGASAYVRFVARHHLALVPTIEGLDPHLKRWDSLRIVSLSEPVGGGAETPPLFAMFNSMKANYLVARRLAYRALTREERDTGLYIDTLDYAVYGVKPATLLLAQRAAMDVLDQIAAALNEYLAVGVDARWVYFSNLWRENNKVPQWRDVLEKEIGLGNVATIALGELAEDLAGGYLHRKRKARHASTHRFTVLHDMKGSPRPSPAIEHVRLDTFEQETIETLQAVRAAILYFVELVARREHRERSGSPSLPLFLPTHHRVRGER